MVAGDFNDISNAGEKGGGRVKAQKNMVSFNKLIADLQLTDVGFKGQQFT